MNDELDNGIPRDDEDDPVRPRIASPGIATPSASMPAVALRGLPAVAPAAAAQNRTAADQAELNRLQTTGSGVSQIKNPWARGALRGLEGIGSALLPRQVAAIPGTEAHHQQLIGEQEGLIGTELGNEEKKANVGKTGAETEEAGARTGLIKAQTDLAKNPKTGLTPEETTLHDLMTGGENGQPRLNPETQKPYTYIEAYQAMKQAGQDVKPEKTKNDFEQFYGDWLKDNNFPDTAHNRLMARKQYAAAGQAPQHEPRQMIVTPDGTVTEVTPGMKIPQGSKTLSGDLAGAKPNAEELKRSEMAENMNENLDKLEEIVKRRPDLFGPLAGRITQGKMMLGSDDPDIGALNTIKDQIGMAQQSAHSMRSAQHVEAAANSILNGFKNGPDAINKSIGTARDSLKTFTKDVQEGNPSTKSPAKKESGGAGSAAGTVMMKAPNGSTQPVPADQVDHYKKLGATVVQ
jgi:hypothetical protein